MKILVTGSDSMLAADLLPALVDRGYDVVGKGHRSLDITDFTALLYCIGEADPDILINTAAYTAVDRAEKEGALAARVNTEGAETLAMACRKSGVALVHISTDFVFDGAKGSPYTEEDGTNPLGVYGRTKFEGEERIRGVLPGALIVRTSWLYGTGGANFASTIGRLAMERETIEVVSDQVGTPTYTVDLAEAMVNIISAGGVGEGGVYNFSNDGECSWYDFAVAIVEELRGRGEDVKVKEVRPVTTEHYGAPAPRPPYSVLSKKKYGALVGKEAPHWRDGLKRYFDSLKR